MKRKYCFLVLLFFCQLSFGSGHFIYVIEKNGVYGGAYGQMKKIKGADPKTFEFVDPHDTPWGLLVTYAKDKARVYHYNTPIAGADPKTFEVLSRKYVKDINHVYNVESWHSIEKDYDAPTFEVLGNSFFRDKNAVYYEHNLSPQAIRLEGVDAASFEILWGTYYMKDKNRVYYYREQEPGGLVTKVLEDSDPDSFVVEVASSPYSRDANNVYYDGERLVDVDPNAFKRIMSTKYGTDGKNVYYQSTKLPDADAGKFRLENKNVGMTDRYIYYWGTKLEGIHPDNFTFCNKRYPYYIKNDSVVYFQNMRIENADAATFEDDGYGDDAKDKNNSYIRGKISEKGPILFGVYESGVYFRNSSHQKLPNADPSTFKILSPYYGKDKKAVYCCDKEIENADVATFQLISELVGKDKTAVYHGKERIVGADVQTYRQLNKRYGKDSKNIFFDAKVMKGADWSSFETIDYIYAKDKNRVYFKEEIIESADPKTFQEVGYLFYKDKNNVYLENSKIENADPASFEVFKLTYKDYSKDKNHVYYKTSILEGADPKTFKHFIGSSYWMDKDHVYFDGKRFENSDASTFELLDGPYYRDKNNVYYHNIVMDADVQTFKIIRESYAIDKDHVFWNSRINEEYDIKNFNVKDLYYPFK